MLIDTSGFLCLNDNGEPHHEKAVALNNAAVYRVTTNYVLTEYVALAHIRGVSRSEIIKFSTQILNENKLEIVWVDEELHRRAIELLQQRPDKNYSLCDAVSFALMRERGITESLTTDKHFEQESFIRLLK